MSDIQYIFVRAHVHDIKNLAETIGETPGLTRTQKAALLEDVLSNVFNVLDDVTRTAPDKAPELWKERADKSENIYDFIRRVYADYIDTIRRKDLRRLDFSLYKSLYRPGHDHSKKGDFLPIISKANDRLLASLNGPPSLTKIRKQMPTYLRRQLLLYETLSARRSREKNNNKSKVGPV